MNTYTHNERSRAASLYLQQARCNRRDFAKAARQRNAALAAYHLRRANEWTIKGQALVGKNGRL